MIERVNAGEVSAAPPKVRRRRRDRRAAAQHHGVSGIPDVSGPTVLRRRLVAAADPVPNHAGPALLLLPAHGPSCPGRSSRVGVALAGATPVRRVRPRRPLRPMPASRSHRRVGRRGRSAARRRRLLSADPAARFAPGGRADSVEATRFKTALRDTFALVQASAQVAAHPPRTRSISARVAAPPRSALIRRGRSHAVCCRHVRAAADRDELGEASSSRWPIRSSTADVRAAERTCRRSCSCRTST